MKVKFTIIVSAIVLILSLAAFKQEESKSDYMRLYDQLYLNFEQSVTRLHRYSIESNCKYDSLKQLIHQARMNLKPMDFWWRYVDPINYKLVNGPLPVEWETEVFEKYEKPYKRLGGGLTLAEIALNDGDTNALTDYIANLPESIKHFRADSVKRILDEPDHFALCNRLFILNLSTIYTTGFECPESTRILPELLEMLQTNQLITKAFEATFPERQYTAQYHQSFDSTIDFIKEQILTGYAGFNHFTFVSNYINPLYRINADYILKNKVRSASFVDYSINKEAKSIFDKNLYYGQNVKGVFLRVTDPVALKSIEDLGLMLFFDPILSGNNQRSCASCHMPEQYFTDTTRSSALQFNHAGNLARNTPSLINAEFNHLIMQDGKFYSLQDQALAVITNPLEMGCNKSDILKKVMSVKTYSKQLKQLCELTTQAQTPSLDHILSALTYYYSNHSKNSSDFELAMEQKQVLPKDAIKGFNLFMSKGQCATCHFLPHFNGVKPPYVGSEFEVLGVPDDTSFSKFGSDSGRYLINPATETAFAFRTGTLKNIAKTAPYMHNGVFKTLKEVMVFYNNGGGNGRGLNISNQTLSSDKLELTDEEMKQIIAFMECLTEPIAIKRPESLPVSSKKDLKNRKIGGDY
jgi:cytochrome c peroxidase